MISWDEIKEGDTIHALIFNPNTYLYEYQEIKVKKNCISRFGLRCIQFKITDLSICRRKRIKLFISDDNTQILSEEDPIKFSSNLYSTEKDSLRLFLREILKSKIISLKIEVSSKCQLIKYLENYVKNNYTL